MRIASAASLLATLALLPPALHAQGSATLDTDRTIITVTGQARATLTPDRATITFLLEPQAMSVEEAANRVAAVERSVLDTLRRFNLPAGAIQTLNGGVNPYRGNGMPQAAPAFSGRSAIRVELTRVDQLSAISAAGLAKGATMVSQPVLTYAASDSVRRALLPQAFQAARRDAEALAAAGGGRLGRLLELSSVNTPNLISEQNQMMTIAGMMYDSGQRASPSTVVIVSVTTRWLLVRQ